MPLHVALEECAINSEGTGNDLFFTIGDAFTTTYVP